MHHEEGGSHHEDEDERLERRKRGDPPSQLIDARIKELNDWLLQSKQPLPQWLLLTKAKVQHVKS